MVVFKALVTTHHLMVHGNEVNEVNSTFFFFGGEWGHYGGLFCFSLIRRRRGGNTWFKIIENTILIFYLAIF